MAGDSEGDGTGLAGRGAWAQRGGRVPWQGLGPTLRPRLSLPRRELPHRRDVRLRCRLQLLQLFVSLAPTGCSCTRVGASAPGWVPVPAAEMPQPCSMVGAVQHGGTGGHTRGARTG